MSGPELGAGASAAVPFPDALRAWARVAALSFGGPAGQIAVMHRIIVEEKGWVDEARFLRGLNFCMLLPGPEAHQLTIYLGWLMHGLRGGLVAGSLFVLPGLVSMLALSALYVAFGRSEIVTGLFFGLKAAVLAIVLQALLRIARRALTDRPHRAIAFAAFAAIFLFGIPFPLIILAAGLAGWLTGRGVEGDGAPPWAGADVAAVPAGPLRGYGAPLAIALLWLGPVAAAALVLGPENVFARLAIFFSQMAVVTFGGAYAVLAYVAQEAVQNYGWLQPGEMLDGLGMAETTPGPLIMVVQFVGFVAAFRNPGGLDPWLAATLGALVASWVTFLPSFLWIFLGAPHVERLYRNAALGAALSAITAAVVGVIFNLAVWFALHVVFAEVAPWSGLGLSLDLPVPSSLDLAALVLTAGAVFAVFRLGTGMALTLAVTAALGLGWTLVTSG
ncbi:MAG TPA: chromate efflux transporter [Amaricoccus sp.]|uniref:chromate efflux transporter n=1 Tax=Amaricoccus sp. TaxID=1872485 RepID=UPI002BD524F8|nr:chromate efflux transporter [Amaricoccus sp.]HMQ93219.1 chromate efflux transporter [Amaricoccus sp.]HMR53064.1 chromate efflux transporter [Amaricoccus sp.]HMR61062.1 chromate efflux transporter [Amaricoccus sp.]HMT99983.1 chromate efflux transporter [Amaricoccus sp.]